MALTRELHTSWIDVANRAQGPNSLALPVNQPIPVGTSLYVISYRSIGNTVSIYKSSDNGNTWALKDAANQPPNPTLGVAFYFDGTSFICAFVTSLAGAPLVLQNFSTLTDTWGAVYGAAGAPAAVFKTYAIFKRVDGTLGIIYGDAVGDKFISYDPNTTLYIAPVAISAVLGTRAAAMDLTGKIHLILTNGNFSTVAYAAITTANVLVAAANFANNFQNNDGQNPVGTLIALADRLAWACVIVDPVTGATADTYVYQGTPLAAPVWTLSAKIKAQVGSNPCYQPNLFQDASGLWLIASTNNSTDANPNQRLTGFLNAAVTPLVGWTALDTMYDLATDDVPPNGSRTSTLSGSQGQECNNGASGYITAQPLNTVAATHLMAYIGKWFFPGPVASMAFGAGGNAGIPGKPLPWPRCPDPNPCFQRDYKSVM